MTRRGSTPGGPPPRIVLAPDKFKGSLTARQVADAVAEGIRRIRPDADIVRVPVADGGEGTVDAAIAAGFEARTVRVTGPTGEQIRTSFAYNRSVAVVEAAAACGLYQLPGGVLAPLTATSRGVGELIRAALDTGCGTIILGVGGSACTDGGAGLLDALGASLLDADGRPVGPGGGALTDIADLDLHRLDPRVREAELVLASDVDNPLLGIRGAAAVFGPQKGAGPSEVAALEAGLAHWAELVAQHTGFDAADRPGAGAAGGIGFAALAVLGAHRSSGIDVLLDLVGFDRIVRGADLVVTGEGSLDAQTLHGKAPAGVAARAGRAGIRTIAVAGRQLLDEARLRAAGFAAAYPLTDLEPDTRRCQDEAAALLRRQGERIAREQLTAPIPPPPHSPS
ncbi:glycerate kinase [Nocardia vaccinii]|uniref:glycerate kinase n=1 Tax=Nocardia vaccinii TaxID=1822 RepID=UPI00082A05DA|nr:glycerate kinase [Nocardia vaccinii]